MYPMTWHPVLLVVGADLVDYTKSDLTIAVSAQRRSCDHKYVVKGHQAHYLYKL